MKTVHRYLSWLPALLLLALVFVPALSVAIDDNFLVAFGARVLIYAIAACALNIALGLRERFAMHRNTLLNRFLIGL